jgi:fumarate reductase iron-sulfur subunit
MNFNFHIKRFIPVKKGLQQAPHYVEYKVKGNANMTVLDALTKIQDEQDGTLSFRWSCRMGICGSDGMLVNGKPVLACSTYCVDVAKNGEIRVDPMRNMPIIKDLVVDIDEVMNKLRSVMPYTDRMANVPLGLGPTKQSKGQLKKLAKTSQCIKCMLCYSACPTYGQDKDFVGPAAGALAYRYNEDTRDDKKSERLDKLSREKDGTGGCSYIGECSTACPKRVDPAQALQRLKVSGAFNMLNPLKK